MVWYRLTPRISRRYISCAIGGTHADVILIQTEGRKGLLASSCLGKEKVKLQLLYLFGLTWVWGCFVDGDIDR